MFKPQRRSLGLFVVLLSCPMGLHGEPPVIQHGSGRPGQTRPFSGYIDPRRESNNGVDLNQGVTQIEILFSEPVFGDDQQGDLTPGNFVLTATGGAAAPAVAVVQTEGALVRLILDGPITATREWTTVRAEVFNAAGEPIPNQGDLGPNLEPDRIDIGFLPADVDQNGIAQPADLIRMIQLTLENPEPGQGLQADYTDTNRNGTLEPLDMLIFRQLLFGTGSSATEAWSGATIRALPGACTPDSCPPGLFCFQGECVPGCETTKDCDDEDPCTQDQCIDLICMNTPMDCDDADDCTDDACVAGECVHDDVECDEGESCVDGDCVRACDFASDCDDDDACTADVCVNELCDNIPFDCDDLNLCTVDSCDDGVCSNVAITCPAGSSCVGGACVPDGGNGNGNTNGNGNGNSNDNSGGGGGGGNSNQNQNGNVNANGNDNDNTNSNANQNDNGGGAVPTIDLAVTTFNAEDNVFIPGVPVAVEIEGTQLGTAAMVPGARLSLSVAPFLTVTPQGGSVGGSLSGDGTLFTGPAVDLEPGQFVTMELLLSLADGQDIPDEVLAEGIVLTASIEGAGDTNEANNSRSLNFTVSIDGPPGQPEPQVKPRAPFPLDDIGSCGCGAGAAPTAVMLLLGLALIRGRVRHRHPRR